MYGVEMWTESMKRKIQEYKSIIAYWTISLKTQQMFLTHDTYGNGKMWFWKPRDQIFKRDIENLDFTLKFKGNCRKQKNRPPDF